MQLETLLPLGKVDPGLRAPDIPLDLSTVAEQARLIEEMGYSGLVIEETKDDPFVILALAAQATTRLRIGTAVAIAFPRSPTILAASAWSLQKLSKGRFTLGVGTQVRGHIERRFGLKWSPPGPWIREYIVALRSIWDCWQNGTPLNVTGEHYNIDLMVPLFNPGPIEHPEIPIHLAAVKPFLCQVAGEVADGIRPHPVCTPSYIEHLMLPAIRAGAIKAGRSLEGFKISMKPLVAAAATKEELAVKVRDARARIAFYASTPAYKPAFEHLGLGDLAEQCSVYSREQRWEELPRQISDEVLNQFVTIGTYDDIAEKLHQRFGDVVTNIEFSISVKDPKEKALLARLVSDLERRDTREVRRKICGS